MKILAIGCVHGNLEKIKQMPLEEVDLILLAGDLGKADLARELAFRKGPEPTDEEERAAFIETENSIFPVFEYLSKLAPIFTIYGNVEVTPHIVGGEETFADEINLTKRLERIRGVKVISGQTIDYKGIRIGGLDYFLDESWAKEFKPNDRARMKVAKEQTARAKEMLEKFGNVDILLCHQPPYGVLDKVTASFIPTAWQGKNAGSKAILEYIKKMQPVYVLCGHIHEGEGVAKIGNTIVYNLGDTGYKIIDI